MPSSIDFRIVGRIAEAQDRLVLRTQLMNSGVSRQTIDRMRQRGQLIDVFPGVYLVGVAGLSHREFLRACVLHAGPLAWPYGRSGLELRGALEDKSGFATLLTTKDMPTPIRTVARLTDGGIGILHTRRVRSATEVYTELIDGFHTTTITRAMADFAANEGRHKLARAWREATFLSLLDADAIERELKEKRRPGNAAVRERLRNARPVTRPGMVIRSRTGELPFLELVRELGLPEPLVNIPMVLDGHRFVPDFRWLNGLVVETDGGMHDIGWHRLADDERTVHLEKAGLSVHRVPNDDLANDRLGCGERLLDAYRERDRAVAARNLATAPG